VILHRLRGDKRKLSYGDLQKLPPSVAAMEMGFEYNFGIETAVTLKSSN
jgi:hypothetical protein